MEPFRGYLLSLTAAAIVCCLVKSIPIGKAPASLIRMLCGIFMACTLIQPILSVKFTDFSSGINIYSQEAEAAAAMGEDAAAKNMVEVIKANTEAYILDKAAAMEVELNVEVILDGLIPDKAVLRGAVSPHARSTLSQWIAQQIGIPGEEQSWIVTP